MVLYIANCWVNGCSVYLNSCLITCCYMKILKQGPSFLQNHMIFPCQAGVSGTPWCFLRSVLSDLIGGFRPSWNMPLTHFCETHCLTSTLECIRGLTFKDYKTLMSLTFYLTLPKIPISWPRAIFLGLCFHLYFASFKSTIN